MPLIRLNNVSKSYQFSKIQMQVLQEINLEIESGEYVAVMGPSGAGKSTLMHIMGLLTAPSAGEYYLDQRSTTSLRPKEAAAIRCHKIGFIFQDFQLIEWGSSLYNVLIPLMHVRLSRRERYDRAGYWLARLGMEHRLNHRPRELSGGERQRVAIARALAMDPPIILADEAIGNLDRQRGREILDIFDEINAQGRIVVHVTHSREVAERAHRIIGILDGRLTP